MNDLMYCNEKRKAITAKYVKTHINDIDSCSEKSM